jgi:sodium/bile acid cotransporter 7
MSGASAWWRKNWFVTGLAAAVALGFALPGPGAPDGWMRPALTTKAAVALIFFFQGLSLNLAELRAGIASWRLHIYVEGFVFVVFPLIGLLADATVFRFLPADLRTGFLFLCVLPSTISSCVVYTALAGGNTAGALFNASVSNVAGVVVTPLWIGAILSVGGHSFALAPVIGSIASLVLLPLVIGQLVRPAIRATAAKATPILRIVSSVLILFMVYTAFAGSVAKGVWSGLGAGAIAGALVGSIGLFGLVLGLVWATTRSAGLDIKDRIAALMCAPQKTLAAGVPMAQLVFAGHPGLGLILLPVLVYHPVQLIVGAWLIPRLRDRG